MNFIQWLNEAKSVIDYDRVLGTLISPSASKTDLAIASDFLSENGDEELGTYLRAFIQPINSGDYPTLNKTWGYVAPNDDYVAIFEKRNMNKDRKFYLLKFRTGELSKVNIRVVGWVMPGEPIPPDEINIFKDEVQVITSVSFAVWNESHLFGSRSIAEKMSRQNSRNKRK